MANLCAEHFSQNITSTKYNLADPWKQPKQIEFVYMHVFPHKDIQISIPAAQWKEPALEIKGKGINIIHD